MSELTYNRLTHFTTIAVNVETTIQRNNTNRLFLPWFGHNWMRANRTAWRKASKI